MFAVTKMVSTVTFAGRCEIKRARLGCGSIGEDKPQKACCRTGKNARPAGDDRPGETRQSASGVRALLVLLELLALDDAGQRGRAAGRIARRRAVFLAQRAERVDGRAAHV